MLLSIVTYSFVRRRRDYASVMQVVADHYELTVTAASVQRARQVLGPQAPAAAPADAARPAPAAPAEPPKYGERIVPHQGADDAESPSPDAASDAAPDAPSDDTAGAPGTRNEP